VSNRRIALLVGLLIGLGAIALGLALAWHSQESQIASPVAATPVAVSTALHCLSINGLPDPVCTPGVADSRITQDNIQTTICVSGYTKTVRPSTTYTNALKRRQISEYGYTDTNLADFEEDHLIPLELGGHPTDPKNLWPEQRSGADAAAKKDGIENSLHSKVCTGLVTLAEAQAAISRNWELAIG
jgi:hypothetical protein